MRTCSLVLSIALFTAFTSMPSPSQDRNPAKPQVEVPSIAPDPKDVASIDAIIRAFYEVISGPAGKPRQWARDRTLYWPNVRFNIVSVDSHGKTSVRSLTHQEFVDSSNDNLVKRGFFETEIHRVTQRFGNIAQVFSTYEGREGQQGALLERGINSIELLYDGQRWWITSANWQDESKDFPIPEQYLPKPEKELHSE